MKIILLISIFLAFALYTSETFACSCDLPLNKSINAQVKDAYKISSSVFVAKVIGIKKYPNAYFVEVKLSVENFWKGTLSKEIFIQTGLAMVIVAIILKLAKNISFMPTVQMKS